MQTWRRKCVVSSSDESDPEDGKKKGELKAATPSKLSTLPNDHVMILQEEKTAVKSKKEKNKRTQKEIRDKETPQKETIESKETPQKEIKENSTSSG